MPVAASSKSSHDQRVEVQNHGLEQNNPPLKEKRGMGFGRLFSWGKKKKENSIAGNERKAAALAEIGAKLAKCEELDREIRKEMENYQRAEEQEEKSRNNLLRSAAERKLLEAEKAAEEKAAEEVRKQIAEKDAQAEEIQRKIDALKAKMAAKAAARAAAEAAQ